MATTNSKKYFDVSKPGKTPANATSRPVIVTNRSIVKDPTLKEEDDNEEAQSPLPKTASKVIAPPRTDDADTTVEPAKEGSASEPDTAKPKPTDAKEPEPEVETTQEEEPANVPDVDDQIDPGRKDEKRAEELNEAEKAKQEQLDKLVASGKYTVPIGHIKRNRRVRRTLGIVVILLLLAAISVFLLMDAGIIKTSVTLPVDLIHN